MGRRRKRPPRHKKLGEFVEKIIARWLEQNAGKTAGDLAKLVGLKSAETLSRWRTGDLAPRPVRLEKLLKLAGFDLQDCLVLPDEVIPRARIYRQAESEIASVTDERIRRVTAPEFEKLNAAISELREMLRAPPARPG